MRINEIITEAGWKGPLIGAGLGGLIGGPVGAFAGGLGAYLLGSSSERKDKQRKLGAVYKVYFDNKEISSDLYDIDKAHEIIKDLSSKPHDVEKWFYIVNTINGKIEYKYKTKTDLLGQHFNIHHGNSLDPDEIPSTQISTHNNTPVKVQDPKYKEVKYFSKDFVDIVKKKAKRHEWDITTVSHYLQKLSRDGEKPFGHPADWVKLKSMTTDDYSVNSLKELGEKIRQEFKKSTDYYREKEKS